jgi:hypothetical protein
VLTDSARQLKATKDWVVVQSEQSLHELVRRIEKICVGFEDHKQSVFNLVQSLKTLLLYSQSENETVEEYTRNFRSLWDTVEAFGVLPGIQDGLVEAELRRRNITNPSPMQLSEAEDMSIKQVKAAMLISGASRQKYGRLKDELADDYLLGSDHYPDTLEKAGRILANYQNTRASKPYRVNANETGVAFLQHGGRGGQGAGRGGQEDRRVKTEGKSGSGESSGEGDDDVSTIIGRTSGDAAKTNSKGGSHCFNCGSPSHWAYECPQLSREQQSQLHMNLESHEETTQEAAKTHISC